ncbi:MAG: hypothetical protein ACI82A_002871 [Candidatus Azotimanducaceae bacterium]|jgi:hypothetical protein
MTSRKIVDLVSSDSERIDLIARFLFGCFRKYAPTWLPDHAACLRQINRSLEADKSSRVMLDDDGHRQVTCR